jgi:hypothetical protein
MTALQKKHLPGIRSAGGWPVSKRLDELIAPATALSPPGGPLLPEGWAVQYGGREPPSTASVVP